MKSFLILLLILVSSHFVRDDVSMSNIDQKLHKKINRQLAKIWPEHTLRLDPYNHSIKDTVCLPASFTFLILSDKTNKEVAIDTLGYLYKNRVYSCRPGGCSDRRDDVSSGMLEGAEYFEYFAILDEKGKVMKVDVYNYQATHGQDICSRGWLKQFIGFGGAEELIYGKNVQAISGATISGSSITVDIQERVTCLQKSLIGN